MTAINTIFGPAQIGPLMYSGSSYTLDDADDSIGMIFSIPKDGIITDVGVYCALVTGNPPAYNIGLVTVTPSTGAPTSTPYGGSAGATKDFTLAQWEWVTLPTPATAVRGDQVSLRIWPTGTPPDVSNRANFSTTGTGNIVHPSVPNYTTSWTGNNGYPLGWAVRYNDGTVYGFATNIVNTAPEIESDTTPDEIGALFTSPFNMVCVGARIMLLATDPSAPYTVKLYDSLNNVLGTIVVTDEDMYWGAGTLDFTWPVQISLIAGQQYRLTITSDSTTLGVTIGNLTFESLASKNNNITLPEVSHWVRTSRTNGGAWSEVTTDYPWFGLFINDISIPSSGGTINNYTVPMLPVDGLR